MQRKLYEHIASRVIAMHNCHESGNSEWLHKHAAALKWLVKNYMPSGSGIDTGTKLEESSANRIVFSFSFHHMDENGGYDGWTDHTVIVTPSLLSGINLRITSRDRNDVKEYIYQVFEAALTAEIEDANDRLKDVVAAA